jgi:putative sigma-54 modulation protein
MIFTNAQENFKKMKLVIYFSQKVCYNIYAERKYRKVHKLKGAKTMKITFTGKQNSFPSYQIPVAEKKLGKFDRIFKDGATANVKAVKKGNLESVEVTIESMGTIYRSEKQAETVLIALDMAIEALERQIRKHKTKLEKRLREGAFERNAEIPEPVDPQIEEEKLDIVFKTKTFAIKPMSPEEAVLQMELLGHSFFVFENDTTGKVNVVYVRKSGDYGLIAQE